MNRLHYDRSEGQQHKNLIIISNGGVAFVLTSDDLDVREIIFFYGELEHSSG